MFLIKGLFFPAGQDPTYSIGFVTSAIETNLAIITASLPALKPLFKRWFPSVFGVDKFQDPYWLRSDMTRIAISGGGGRRRSASAIHDEVL